MVTDFDVAQRLVTDLDIAEDTARGAVEEFISQCETLDGVPYDRDGLTTEQADFIYGAVVAWLDTDVEAGAALGAVERSARRLRESQAECEFLAGVRDQAVVRALAAGASVVDTARAAGISRNSVYDIKKRTTPGLG